MKKLDKKIFLKSQLLTKLGVKHGFFTRNGGISSDEYKSLNCKFNCSDKNENVENNLITVTKLTRAAVKK
jgi:copper oxidase (laccase) domain-containing protein